MPALLPLACVALFSPPIPNPWQPSRRYVVTVTRAPPRRDVPPSDNHTPRPQKLDFCGRTVHRFRILLGS